MSEARPPMDDHLRAAIIQIAADVRELRAVLVQVSIDLRGLPKTVAAAVARHPASAVAD